MPFEVDGPPLCFSTSIITKSCWEAWPTGAQSNHLHFHSLPPQSSCHVLLVVCFSVVSHCPHTHIPFATAPIYICCFVRVLVPRLYTLFASFSTHHAQPTHSTRHHHTHAQQLHLSWWGPSLRLGNSRTHINSLHASMSACVVAYRLSHEHRGGSPFVLVVRFTCLIVDNNFCSGEVLEMGLYKKHLKHVSSRWGVVLVTMRIMNVSGP